MPTDSTKSGATPPDAVPPSAPKPDAVSPSATPPGAAPRAAWRWAVHAGLLGAYPLFIGLMALRRDSAAGPALGGSAGSLLAALSLDLALFGTLLGAACWASRVSRDWLYWRWPPRLSALPLGLAYSVALRLAVGLVVGFAVLAALVLGLVNREELQQFMAANSPDVGSLVDLDAMRTNPVYFWLLVTLVSFVFAGLREELWRAAFMAGLRGLWPERLGTRGGQLAAAAAAAVVFGLGHLGQGPLAAAQAGLLGFGFGVVMVLHRSIWPAVLAHGFFDAASLALLPRLAETVQHLQRAAPH